MKRLLLGVLMLSVMLVASSGFAAVVSYGTLFDSQDDIDANWRVVSGSWGLVDNPNSEVAADLIYGAADPVTDPQASSYLNRPGFYLPSTRLNMDAIFGAPGEESAIGVYFGATDEDSHVAFLYRDDDNNLSFGVNTYSKTTATEYMFGLGKIASEDDVYWLNIDIDEDNNLDWSVRVRNTSGGYDGLNSGEYDGSIDVRTGVIGIFTQAENGFGYFAASYETVPVPGSMLLLSMGIIGLAGLKRRQK